jgi:nitroimidazol reductase NimA-like FMN-containing flavoprotein (pyridoxamine 5'-phosphate oxidase superfamily)
LVEEGNREMGPDTARTPMEAIPRDECLELLNRRDVGRIAVVVEGRPQIFPVNYVVRAGAIVFRTAPGTKLSHAPGSPVAFEIDEYLPVAGVGWSVMVQGTARDVTAAENDFAWAMRPATVHPLAPGEKPHKVAVDPVEITGRRFRLKG